MKSDIMMLPEGDSQASKDAPNQEPSGSNDEISNLLDQRMNELPDKQKKFVLDYLTPETVGLLGVILGQEAVDYFAPFVDPNKMAVIQERPKDAQSQQATPDQQQQQPAPAGPQSGLLSQAAPAPQQGSILPVQAQ